MNLFAITSLAVSVCCLGLAIFVFIIAKTKLHRIWALFNFTCFLWAIGTFFAAIAKSPFHAELAWRWAYGPGAIVPCTFYCFTHSYCELKQRKVLYLLFVAGLTVGLVNSFSPNFVNEITYVFGSFYYNKATVPYNILIIYLTASVLLSFKELYVYYKTCKGEKRSQALYFLIGFGIGWSGGVATFLPSYNILIYPSGNILVCIYTLFMTYAIFKHQLMDIRIVIKKSVVYTLLIAFITILYFLFAYITEKLFQNIIGYTSFFVSVATAATIAVIFIPLKNAIQAAVDRSLFSSSLNEMAEQNILLRREVAQSEKHKAVASLAGSIAHEIKNPLTALKTFFEYYPEKSADPGFMAKFNKIATQEFGRIETLVKQLLDFAKPSPANFEKADIHALIDDTLGLLSHKLETNKITVKKQLVGATGRSPLLTIDKGKIKQALLNILLNAADAMPDGGALTIRTMLHASRFTITIEDTGKGISKKDLKHIFEPFYSKKEAGTGLGLAITQGIIQEHKGNIKAESKIGRGTKISINFSKLVSE